ncbi:MAG: HEPN domain-containing protein [Methanospirillum sp.]|uniref:HEPN domain-containing protein n=1 Tax=Methanospirillum sp. TaxID=45200 RepID=UPI0023702285|nr:HEPN domain-containing protein [Methanospirillum sp.]MDD1727574.1 HEPN domain-containing protein [Methanospirillum sp.]
MTDYEEIGDRWIKQAVHDLQIAEKNLSIGGFDSAAFYSHQSVEKMLGADLGIRALHPKNP